MFKVKTLNIDQVILHTVMYHSLTSTYTPNFIEVEETSCGRTDVRTHVRMDGHLRPALLGRLCQRVNLKSSSTERHVFHSEVTAVSTSSSVLANSYRRAMASPAQMRTSTSAFCSRSDNLLSCLHITSQVFINHYYILSK